MVNKGGSTLHCLSEDRAEYTLAQIYASWSGLSLKEYIIAIQ